MSNQLADLKPLKENKLWQDAVAVTEYVYSLTPQLPEEEKWDMISKLRQNAFELPHDISQVAGSTDPRDICYGLDCAQRHAYAIYNGLTLAKRLHEVRIQPEIMLQLDSLIKNVQQFRNTTVADIPAYAELFDAPAEAGDKPR